MGAPGPFTGNLGAVVECGELGITIMMLCVFIDYL